LIFEGPLGEAAFLMSGELRILVTGFEPFGGASWNPSGHVARALHGHKAVGGAIVGRVLPVLWGKAPRLLEEWLEELRPQVVIALGMARDCIEIEIQATNRRHPERRDNEGALPVPARAIATNSLPSALPVDAIVRALMEDGEVRVSEDTGGFLCEEVFYALMSRRAEVLAEKRWPLLRAGFIHVPNDRFVVDEVERRRLEGRVLRAIETTIAGLALEA
jgi:pyroglutamyl-peptidase